MTVSISKPALNLRRELAKGAEAYSEQKFYFDSLVTNGTFDGNIDGWTDSSVANGSIAYGTNALNLVTTDSGDARASQIITTVIGTNYTWSIDSAVVSGSPSGLFRIGTNLAGTQQASQSVTFGSSYSGTFVAASTTTYLTAYNSDNAGSTGSMDNISIFEVDANDDVIHTMPKGWKPKDVFEDGLLQREGSSHDYEVIFDGFNYVVKPTVAPTASTETAVIGVKA